MNTNLDSRATWVENQSYQNQEDKSTAEDVKKWKEEKFEQGKSTTSKLKLAGASRIDLFDSEKFLLPGVTLHLRLHRSGNDFSLHSLVESDDKNVDFIEGASVYVTRLILKDTVRLSIEKELIDAPAHYPSTEKMNKSFILSLKLDKTIFWKKNVSETDLVRRVTLCVATNEQFRGTRDTDAFDY